ncbi:hypothetical protein HY413_00370 [Candidatus Kaiserbacteria bacterium]|nr:hypothetical protein [Candidatus Kaiserbacteria bacterium]
MSSFGYGPRKRTRGPKGAFNFADFGKVDFGAALDHALQYEESIRRNIDRRMNGDSGWIVEITRPQFAVPGIEITLSKKAKEGEKRKTVSHQSGAVCCAVIRPGELQIATKELGQVIAEVAPTNMKLLRLLPPLSNNLGGIGEALDAKLVFRVIIDDYSQFLSRRRKRKCNGTTP